MVHVIESCGKHPFCGKCKAHFTDWFYIIFAFLPVIRILSLLGGVIHKININCWGTPQGLWNINLTGLQREDIVSTWSKRKVTKKYSQRELFIHGYLFKQLRTHWKLCIKFRCSCKFHRDIIGRPLNSRLHRFFSTHLRHYITQNSVEIARRQTLCRTLKFDK